MNAGARSPTPSRFFSPPAAADRTFAADPAFDAADTVFDAATDWTFVVADWTLVTAAGFAFDTAPFAFEVAPAFATAPFAFEVAPVGRHTLRVGTPAELDAGVFQREFEVEVGGETAPPLVLEL